MARETIKHLYTRAKHLSHVLVALMWSTLSFLGGLMRAPGTLPVRNIQHLALSGPIEMVSTLLLLGLCGGTLLVSLDALL